MGKLIALLFLLILASSCVVVREYDKVYVNAEEMQLSARPCERFETNFHIYREASSGANGGKTGGGWVTAKPRKRYIKTQYKALTAPRIA